MEIIPGVGVALAKIGETRKVVEGRVGRPVHRLRDPRAVYRTTPPLVVDYSPDNTVDTVSVTYSGYGRHEAFLDGVQLTFRLLDEVVADLLVHGYRGVEDDVGFIFEAGFGVYSMRSLMAGDVGRPEADEAAKPVSEGVMVAPYEYLLSQLS